MNDQNDFWGDTPDWADAPRSRRNPRPADDTVPAERPRGLSSTLKNLWGSAMSAGADATREHRVIDATQIPDSDDDYDTYFADAAPSAAPAGERRSRATETHTSHETFDVGPTGWSGDDWYSDDTDVELTDDDFAPIYATDRGRTAGAGIDPLLTRIGAAVVVLTLFVPLAIGLNSGDGPSDLVASAQVTTPASEPTVVLAAEPVESTDSESVDSGSVYLDPSQLPPAVPVNTEPSSETDAADDSDVPDSAEESSTDADEMPTLASDELQTTSDTGNDSDGDAADSEISTSADVADTANRLAATCTTDYTVVEGDFWIRLADASGVDLADLLDANDATVSTPLYPGADICLPAGATTPAPPATVAATTTTDAPTTTAAPTTTSTTTTSTTTTTTTAPVSTTPAGPADIEQIIRDVWPDELEDRALEIAYRESRYVPTAKNFCCYGLFQIYWSVHQSWLSDIGITDDQQLYDPETNARAAYALYERAGGWGPWSL